MQQDSFLFLLPRNFHSISLQVEILFLFLSLLFFLSRPSSPSFLTSSPPSLMHHHTLLAHSLIHYQYLTHSLMHSHSLTHSITHSLTLFLPPSLAHSLIHSLTNSLTHLLIPHSLLPSLPLFPLPTTQQPLLLNQLPGVKKGFLIGAFEPLVHDRAVQDSGNEIIPNSLHL